MPDSPTALTVLELVEALDEVLGSILELGRGLTADQELLATDCPGWTVHDQIAHVVGLGQVLEGSPPPEADVDHLEHVASDLDRFMEGPVEIRRALPVAAVVDELAGLRPRRIARLRALAEMDGDPETSTPSGDPGPMSKAMLTQVLDPWSHEQDIRRALGLEVPTDTVAGRFCVGRTLTVWSILLPRNVEGVDATLRITVADDDAHQPTVIQLGGGAGDDETTVELSATGAALTRAGFGRGSLDDRLADLSFGGSDDAVAAVRDATTPHLAFTP